MANGMGDGQEVNNRDTAKRVGGKEGDSTVRLIRNYRSTTLSWIT